MVAMPVALLIVTSDSAYAELYKYVDPITGSVEYTTQPKKGAVRVSDGGNLSEVSTGNKAASITFRERALSLKTGMPSSDVEKLLGKPLFTNARTFGSATKKPWNGVSWNYRSMNGQLTVTFYLDDSKLFVNDWVWN